MDQPQLQGPDPELLKDLVRMKMPFGKYKGWLIADIPESYLLWFSNKGFPPGKLGMLMSTCYEIKLNGMNEMIRELKELFGQKRGQ